MYSANFWKSVEAVAAPFNANGTRLAVELPRDPTHGDWTTNAALVLAKAAGKPPRAIASAAGPEGAAGCG